MPATFDRIECPDPGVRYRLALTPQVYARIRAVADRVTGESATALGRRSRSSPPVRVGTVAQISPQPSINNIQRKYP